MNSQIHIIVRKKSNPNTYDTISLTSSFAIGINSIAPLMKTMPEWEICSVMAKGFGGFDNLTDYVKNQLEENTEVSA